MLASEWIEPDENDERLPCMPPRQTMGIMSVSQKSPLLSIAGTPVHVLSLGVVHEDSSRYLNSAGQESGQIKATQCTGL